MSSRRKIVTVVGARPQFIKAAMVSRRIAAHPELREVIVHTGQHFDNNMSAVFFEQLGIPSPAYNLEVNSLSHAAMTSQMMLRLEPVLTAEKPDIVLVYGDTNSTLAGALCAAKLGIPVAHVEAGLRSFNRNMPEELNRVTTDHLSSLLFCPTDTAVRNLRQEGVEQAGARIVQCGDVMLDAARFYGQFSAEHSDIIKRLNLRQFALCTLHRAENTDDISRLTSIVEALEQIHRETPVILPLHPRTRRVLSEHGRPPAITVIEPVTYFDMLELLKACSIVLTDSGGLQKEAYFFGKPCVTLRDETEWVELVECGANVVSGVDSSAIHSAVRSMMNHRANFSRSFYGDGHAAEHIMKELSVVGPVA
ncbi:MAG: UDP-N-acetylglucosamine 2-epimerase (non-hydrolyzing) [Candidatus Zixiibacteriota bacterium]